MTPKHILVADDQPDNRISAILIHSGYDLFLAKNGQEAVEQARLNAPDLILMYLQVPVMDGWAATRLLKADPETASIPIVALTAQDYPLGRLREGGFCAYIGKPASPRDVEQVLELCLEGTRQKKLWADLSSTGAPLRPAR